MKIVIVQTNQIDFSNSLEVSMNMATSGQIKISSI